MPEETAADAEPEVIISEAEQHKKDGNMHFASSDYVKAVAAYNKAIKADPGNGVLYRCVCPPANGRVAVLEAGAPARFAGGLPAPCGPCPVTDVAMRPGSNRAAAFIHLGKETKAIKDAEQAIELKPDWAKGYFRKGAALSALRKWDEAIQMLEKALEVDPKSKEISAMLRETTRKRNAEKGEAKRAAGGEKGSNFKFDLSKGSSTSTKSTSDDTKENDLVHIPAPKDTGREFVGCGSQSVVEQFLKNSLTSAITQFAKQGSKPPSVLPTQLLAVG